MKILFFKYIKFNKYIDMKNYNKILEAINRGIKFALDDFDDNEEIQGQINSKINNKSNLKDWLEWQEWVKKIESRS